MTHRFNQRIYKLLHRKSNPLHSHSKEVNKSPQSPEFLLDGAVISHDVPSYLPRSNPIFPLSFLGLARATHHSVSASSTSPHNSRITNPAELEEEEEEEEEEGILHIQAPASNSHLHHDEAEQEDLIVVPHELELKPPFETHENSSTDSSDFFNLDNNHSRFTDQASSVVPMDGSTLNLSLAPSSRNSSIALPYQLYLPPTASISTSTPTSPPDSSSLSNLDIASLQPPFRPLDSFESNKSLLDLTPLLLYLERYSQRRSSVPAYVQPLVRQGQRDHGLSNFEDGELSGGIGHCESIGTLISA